MPAHLRTQRHAWSVATALAVIAIAAPSATARPALDPPVSAAPAAHASLSARPDVVTPVRASDGFDWASAGIGAGAAGCLLLVVVGAAAAVSRNHRGVHHLT
jgi:hypothetical protein